VRSTALRSRSPLRHFLSSTFKPHFHACVANAAAHGKAGDGQYGYIVGDLIKCCKCGNSLAGSSVLPSGSGAWGVQCTRWLMDGDVKVSRCKSVLNTFTVSSLWGQAGQTPAALAYAAELSAAASAIFRARGGSGKKEKRK
jgi:hypothetical protein